MTILVVALMVGMIADEIKFASSSLECYCRGNLFPRHPFGARGVQYWPPLCDKRNKCKARSGGVCVSIIQCPGLNMARGCSDEPIYDWTSAPGIAYYLQMGARLHTCAEPNCNLNHRLISRKVCPEEANMTHDQVDEIFRFRYRLDKGGEDPDGLVAPSSFTRDLYLRNLEVSETINNHHADNSNNQFKQFSPPAAQSLSSQPDRAITSLVNSAAKAPSLTIPCSWFPGNSNYAHLQSTVIRWLMHIILILFTML